VEYKVLWDVGSEHYVLRVYTSYPREGEGNGVVSVQTSTTAWIFAHEFGHCVGLPDEYSTLGTADSVRYIKPDGSLDASVTAPAVKPASDPSATIMSTYDNTTTLNRHCWNVAIEVQALLRSNLGRAITCTTWLIPSYAAK
jgi:type VI secretion system secreted protein VgrG